MGLFYIWVEYDLILLIILQHNFIFNLTASLYICNTINCLTNQLYGFPPFLPHSTVFFQLCQKKTILCSYSSMEGAITPRALKLIMGTFHHSIEVKCGTEMRFVHKEMYRQDKTHTKIECKIIAR